MSLLFWDSFDHYATADIVEKWSYTWVGTGGGASYDIGAYGRYGTNGAYLERQSAPRTCVIRKNLADTITTLIMGAAVEFVTNFPSADAPIWQWLDNGTIQLELRLNADGSLEVLRGGTVSVGISAAGVFAATDTYYYIEMKATIDGAAGAVEVRFTDDAGNETTVINVAGVNTQNTANAWVDQVELGGYVNNANTVEMYVDDVYVCDNYGSQCNDFLGDTRICALLGAADGVHADWTPSAGVDHYAMVDENPPDGDTTYNSSVTPTDRDSFEMETLPVDVTGPILAVCAVINSRKDDAGDRTLQPSVRVGGIDYDGDSVNIPETYAYHNLYAWEVNPDTGVAWLLAEVNAPLEAGYELAA